MSPLNGFSGPSFLYGAFMGVLLGIMIGVARAWTLKIGPREICLHGRELCHNCKSQGEIIRSTQSAIEAIERCQKSVKEQVRAARKEAYTDAAGIAERSERDWELFLLDGNMLNQRAFIGRKLRAKAEEVGK